MLTLEQTHLTLAQIHSKPDYSSELLILLSFKERRGAKVQRAYLYPLGQNLRRLNHHPG